MRPGAGYCNQLGVVRLAQPVLQFKNVIGEAVCACLKIAPQRAGGVHVGARRAAEAEVDTPRKQRFQGSELLGDNER